MSPSGILVAKHNAQATRKYVHAQVVQWHVAIINERGCHLNLA